MKLKPTAALRTLLSILAVAGGAPSAAQAPPAPPAGRDLCRALAEFTRRTRAEILYDGRLCRGRPAQLVRPGASTEVALSSLLAGTGLGFRKTSDGAFVLFPLPLPLPAQEEEEGAIPDILVTGRRTQNADIRRTENAIQPYRVATHSDIERAHRDNVDQYMRSRAPANADLAAPAQNTYVEAGSVRSQIDLRGLGPTRTLVLVDGRRMPSLPTGAANGAQPDLNGLPVIAIERIETLTGTAGGIYGPGAIGGVVNIVLKRDYRGAEIRLTTGISSRGDSGRAGIEGRVGFTPDGGRTDVMLLGAYSRSQALLVGDRDYFFRSRKLRFANDRSSYEASTVTANSIGVFARGNLVLDPDKGGTSLGSSFTYLPLDFSGTEAERLALLVANAGKVDLSVPRDESGTGRSLVARPEVVSLLVNVRHRFGAKVEGFADLVYYSNAGRLRDNPGSNFYTTLPDAPNNPFGQAVTFSYPEPNTLGESGQRIQTRRITLGLIADLPSGWKANADYAAGRATSDVLQRRLETTRAYGDALRTGRPDGNGRALDPLRDWADFVAASATYLEVHEFTARLVNRFTDASIRMAGPLVTLPGGPLTLTMLAESRREHAAAAKLYERRGTSIGAYDTPDRSLRVRSAYAELRAPFVPHESRSFLRALEFQLAARYDSIRNVFPAQPSIGFPSNDDLVGVDRTAFTFTGGMRFFPLSRLMLRASVATGELPPTAEQLSSVSSFLGVGVGVFDPLRAGRAVGTEGLVQVLRQGRSTMRSERARTLTLGAVFNPWAKRGPRIAVDFSRIERRREVVPFTPTGTEVVANESLYPGRIVRAPPSDADRQAGFAVGRVTAVDLRFGNSGRSRIDSLDVQLDWRKKGPARGEVRLTAAGTWQPGFRTRRSPLEPAFDRIGHIDGPLRIRGNIGAEWSRGATAVGLNLQYHSPYRITYSDPSSTRLNPQLLRYQGAGQIPAQAYVDLFASRALAVGTRQAELGLGISNLLDSSPPILAQPGTPGYSLYADPRRRRFELTLSSKF